MPRSTKFHPGRLALTTVGVCLALGLVRVAAPDRDGAFLPGHLPMAWRFPMDGGSAADADKDRDEARNGLDAIDANVGGVDAPPARAMAYATRGEEAPPRAVWGDILQRADVDLNAVRAALAAYKAGDVVGGDALAKSIADPTSAIALEWSVLRVHPAQAGFARIAAFLRARGDWPSARWLRRHAEENLAGGNVASAAASAYLAEFPPVSAQGEMVQAQLLKDRPQGRAKAAGVARALWREIDMSASAEEKFLKNFSEFLTEADHKARAERLLLKDSTASALRAAERAGKDVLALARAHLALMHGASWRQAEAITPVGLRNDPGLLFARIHNARRADKIDEAANLMQAAPHDAETIGAEEWWVERRLLARKLLDAKDASRAYRICAEHGPLTGENAIEAEFHAGWVALRFLNDPRRAAGHFDAAAKLALTPHSIARFAYWRGRAAEAMGAPASAYYRQAGEQSETYYGQLARAKIGAQSLDLRQPASAASGAERAESVRVVEWLYALGEQEIARQLVLDAAENLTEPAQVAALAWVLTRQADPRVSLLAGKAALRRGVAIDQLAFPTNGVPGFAPLANSVGLPVILSVARQESAFDASAHSGAGAKGLMQMISSTARTAAQHAGVAYAETRLVEDPAFNAQLGAFHLGELLAQYKGSYILTFAAYNAGGGRVREWIDAYGDPRDPAVDPVDWVERIPISETRNYVQRVIENLNIYRVRLGESAPSLASADLRQQRLAAHD